MNLDWMQQAACKGADPEWFHPTPQTGHYYQNAFALCNQCPVKQQCLDYALSFLQQHDLHGIYGGTTARDRRLIRKGKPLKRKRPGPPRQIITGLDDTEQQ